MIGMILTELRTEKGISQVKFAYKLGITPSWYCAIEKERKKPSYQLLRKAAQELNLSEEETDNLCKLLKKNNTKFLSEITNMELRDQLEAKDQQIKEMTALLNEIDGIYSCGINKAETEDDAYILYNSTFTELDKLFNKWEKMRR